MEQLMQMVDQTWLNLVIWTCGLWSEGQHDLYFTVQWFCLISWRLFDNIILWDYESVWPKVWPQNKCRSLWPLFHGLVILPCILKTIWCMNIVIRDYESVWPDIDLKINVSHCDLYFMGHWFCIISWRLSDLWTSYFGIMGQYDQTFDLKMYVTVTYISWSSDFALYLKDYLMDECHIFR